MSLQTLLEAARYVELQDAQRLQQNSSREESREPSPSQLTNGISTYQQDHQISQEFHKRAAGTREVHNKLEKNRRAHLKECFELLKKQLPVPSEEKKSSNLSILQIALRFIQSLRRKEREFEHEMERLAREKIAAQQRLAILKKELLAQWDHIDFNTLLPDHHLIHDDPRLRDHVSQSLTTSTASEGDDALSDQEEPLSKCGVLYSSTSSLSSAATACSPPQLMNSHSLLPSAVHSPQTSVSFPLAAATHTTSTASNHSQTNHTQSNHCGIPQRTTPVRTNQPVHSTTVSIQTQSSDLNGTTGKLKIISARSPATSISVGSIGVQATHVPVSLHTNDIQSISRTREAAETKTTIAVSQHHMQLPISHVVNSPGLAATLVSPTIQLVTPSTLRMLPGDTQPLALTTVSHRLRDMPDNRTTGAITLPTLHLTNKMVGATELNILPANGTIRQGKNQPLTLTPGLTVPNGLLSSAGMTLTPIGSHNLVTPVTVVSQGNQVAHILASGGKVLKGVSVPSLMNAQYLMKPVTVVVSTSSSETSHTNT